MSQTGMPPPGSVYLPNNGDDFIPVDFLEGCMDLRVVLPSKRIVRMSIERRTPMMDLLVQIATYHKISPGGHVIQVMNERSDDFLYYKPSTPIGALDASTIHIIPKHKVSDSIVRKVPMKMLNKPFETTFRLQVRLPRNQLYVLRASPKMTIAEILQKVCEDKNLDESKYEIRNPDHLDERLHPTCTLSDYQLTEVALTHSGRPSHSSRSVSTGDIMRLQQEAELLAREAMVAQRSIMGRGTKAKSSAGNSSLSSGSAGDRSISPDVARGSSVSTPGAARSSSAAMPSATRKKRAAPAPPPSSAVHNKSDYEEIPSDRRRSGSAVGNKSISMSNLTHSDDYAPVAASNLSTISSGSMQSLTSSIASNKRNKRRAPAPPPQPEKIIPEETPSLVYREEEEHSSRKLRDMPPESKEADKPSPAPRTSLTGANDPRSPVSREPIYGKVDPTKKKKKKKGEEVTPRTKEEVAISNMAEKSQQPQQPKDEMKEKVTSFGADDSSPPRVIEPIITIRERVEEEVAALESHQPSVEDERRVDQPPGEGVVTREKSKKRHDTADTDSDKSTTPKTKPPSKPPRSTSSMRPDEEVETSANLSKSHVLSPSPVTATIAAAAAVGGQVQARPDPLQESQHHPVTQHDAVAAAADQVVNRPQSIGDINAVAKPPMSLGAIPKVPKAKKFSKKKEKVEKAPETLNKRFAKQDEKKPAAAAEVTLNKRFVKQKAISDSNDEEAIPVFQQQGKTIVEAKDSYSNEEPMPVLNKRFSSQQKEKTIVETTAAAATPADTSSKMPNFRMAPAANVLAQMSVKKKQKDLKTIVDERGVHTFDDEDEQPQVSVQQQDDDPDLIDDYLLFSMYKRPPPVKKKPKVNPAAIHGLTPEEERRLEEAKQLEEERVKKEEKEKQEKVQRAAEEREARRTELLQKIDKSRQVKRIENNAAVRNKPKGDMTITEDPRHHLSSQFGFDEEQQHRRKVAPNTVELEIDVEEDEFLPRRNRTSSSSSSSEEEQQEVASVVKATGSAMGHFTSSGSALDSQFRTGLETGVTDLKNEEVFAVGDVATLNSKASVTSSEDEPTAEPISIHSEISVKSQEAISQALDESFATIDVKEEEDDTVISFGLKATSIDDDDNDQESPEFEDIQPESRPSFQVVDTSEDEDEEELSEEIMEEPRKEKQCEIVKSKEESPMEKESEIVSVKTKEPEIVPGKSKDPSDDFEKEKPASDAKEEQSEESSDSEDDSKWSKREQKPVSSPPAVVVVRGPMQFSIDSYDAREKKEVPYVKKLTRSDSWNSGRNSPTAAAQARVEPAPKEEGIKEVVDKSPPLNHVTNGTVEDGPIENFSKIVERFDSKRTENRSNVKSFISPPVNKPIVKSEQLTPAVAVAAIPEVILVSRESSPRPKVPDVSTKPELPSNGSSRREEDDRRSSLTHVIGSNVPWIVRKKTSLESNRVMPNDDLTLNLRRKQQPNTNSGGISSRKSLPVVTKASSVGDIYKLGLLQEVSREIDIYDRTAESSVSIVPSAAIQETFAAIKREFITSQSNPQSPIRRSSSVEREGVVTSPRVQEVLRKFGSPVNSIIIEEKSNRPSSVPRHQMNGGNRHQSNVPSPLSSLSSVGSNSSPDHLGSRNSPTPPPKPVATNTVRVMLQQQQPPLPPPVTNGIPIKLDSWKNRIQTGGINGHSEPIKDEMPSNLPRGNAKYLPSGNSYDPLVAKPWKRPSAPLLTNGRDPKVEIVEAKPQFFFGQKVSSNNQQQQLSEGSKQKQSTAIDKVKNNESVSHPKNIQINPGYRIKNYVDPLAARQVFAYGETPKPRQPPPVPIKPTKFSPPSAFEPEFKRPTKQQEQNSDDFERQLLWSKSKLKSYESSNNSNRDTDADSGISLVSPPPPPPPPPPEFDDATVAPPRFNGSSPKTAPAAATAVRRPMAARATSVAATGEKRIDLMSAIREAGGIQSLRKVGSVKNL